MSHRKQVSSSITVIGCLLSETEHRIVILRTGRKIGVKKIVSMGTIEQILAKRKTTQAEIQAYTNSLKKVIDYTNFFIDDDDNGFVSKEDFINDIYSLSGYDLEKLEDFFKKITQRTRLCISPFPRKSDRNDRYYYSVKPISNNVVSSYMLPAIKGMDELIEAYSQDYYNFDLNLGDLHGYAIG